MRRIRAGLTYSNAVSTLALMLALGGTSYAALTLPAGSVGTKQLKNGAVTARKVKAGSLLASNFKPGQIPRGPAGLPGSPGPRGPAGPSTGPAGGALTGSYPNPGLAPGSVTSAALAPGAVGPDQTGKVPAALVDAPFLGPPQSIPNGSLGAVIQWGNVSFDTAGMFNPAQPDRLTAPIAGIYRVTCNLVLTDPTSALHFASLDIDTTDGTVLAEVTLPPLAPHFRAAFSATALVKLTKGRAVSARATQDSSGSWSVDNNTYTNFSLDWLGPAS